LGQRGDGIRLWESDHNRIDANILVGVRDLVVWYSEDNVIARIGAEGLPPWATSVSHGSQRPPAEEIALGRWVYKELLEVICAR
ncbi:MAG: hypothetical protein HYZ27_10815, partial [Deltaproteobacteria bacterium]|nr:hypothetical protein [Deltaproteobacteria bacterium]